jgi:hypothetical protein
MKIVNITVMGDNLEGNLELVYSKQPVSHLNVSFSVQLDNLYVYNLGKEKSSST